MKTGMQMRHTQTPFSRIHSDLQRRRNLAYVCHGEKIASSHCFACGALSLNLFLYGILRHFRLCSVALGCAASSAATAALYCGYK